MLRMAQAPGPEGRWAFPDVWELQARVAPESPRFLGLTVEEALPPRSPGLERKCLWCRSGESIPNTLQTQCLQSHSLAGWSPELRQNELLLGAGGALAAAATLILAEKTEALGQGQGAGCDPSNHSQPGSRAPQSCSHEAHS